MNRIDRKRPLILLLFLLLFAVTPVLYAVGERIDVNSATAEKLADACELSKGQARRLVKNRDSNGPFSSRKDLDRVKGIGEQTIKEIKRRVTTGNNLRCWNCEKVFEVSKHRTLGTCPYCQEKWPKEE